MRWILLPVLRPHIAVAAMSALLFNIALLMPSVFTLQVFDRVFSSRSLATLWALAGIAAVALAFAWIMDVTRARALAAAGHALEELLAPALFGQALVKAGTSGATPPAAADALRDVARLRQFLSGPGAQALFDAPWLPLFLAVIALMHPVLGIGALLASIVLGLLAWFGQRVARSTEEALTPQARALDRTARQAFGQAEVIVALGMADRLTERWRGQQTRHLALQARSTSRATRLAAFGRTLRQAVQIGLLALGAALVIGADASPGIMIAATLLLGRALQPLEQLGVAWRQFAEARAAWERLASSAAPVQAPPSVELPVPQGRLELRRVVFTPAANSVGIKPVPIFRGLDLVVEAGEQLGIIGASGSGKSTLARLMLGIASPQGGQVTLDGAAFSQWARSTLGAYVGWLPQEIALLPGTVAQNISRFGEGDDGQVVAAARLAGAHDLILSLPMGYDTLLSDDGRGLSGGQKQRIALARALYGNPCLVVLDEPDAHLDADGQRALLACLRELKARRTTVVVIGHRASLMAKLDRLTVLRDGLVAAQGTPLEVLGARSGPSPNEPADEGGGRSQVVRFPAAAVSLSGVGA